MNLERSGQNCTQESVNNAIFDIINISKGHNSFKNSRLGLIFEKVRDITDTSHTNLSKAVHVRALTRPNEKA